MYLRKALITIMAGALIPILAPAQDLFRLSFHGHARSLNARGKVSTRPINTEDLIARCVGPNALGTNRLYALVYNATSDSVQVVYATNGAFICEFFSFQGGITNSDRSLLDRFNFVFIPDETNAAGTAVIRHSLRQRTDRISIQGEVQFVLASLEPASVVSGAAVPSAATSVAPTASSTVITTNLTGGTTALSPPSASLGTPPTNGLSALSIMGTNLLPAFSFTNGVICYGSFSGGKSIFAPSNP